MQNKQAKGKAKYEHSETSKPHDQKKQISNTHKSSQAIDRRAMEKK